MRPHNCARSTANLESVGSYVNAAVVRELHAVLPYLLLSYKMVRQVLQYCKSTFKCRTRRYSFSGRSALNRAAPSVCFAGRNNNTGCGNDIVFAVPAEPCRTSYFKVRQGTAHSPVTSEASLLAGDATQAWACGFDAACPEPQESGRGCSGTPHLGVCAARGTQCPCGLCLGRRTPQSKSGRELVRNSNELEAKKGEDECRRRARRDPRHVLRRG